MGFSPFNCVRATGLGTLGLGKLQPKSIRKAKEFLGQLLETLDVMADKKFLRDIEISRAQASKGRREVFVR